MHCCRIVNGIKNKNIKNGLGAMWNASHLAVRLCALRHWKRVSMPPTTQSLRHPLTRAHHIAPRIKTARRSRRKTSNDKMISWKELYQSPERFCMVGTWYFASATNYWYPIWYHNYGRTWSITSLPGLVFRRRRAVFILLTMPPPSLGRAALVMWRGWFKPLPQTTNQRDGSSML